MCDCGNDLALYVWEEVLTDYTDGLCVALACCESEAWRLVAKKDSTAWSNMLRWPEKPVQPESVIERHRPKRITEPEAFLTWGGG